MVFFISMLREVYLDNNLLDALPCILLRVANLRRVHRHGNHNYFKVQDRTGQDRTGQDRTGQDRNLL